MRRCYEGRDTGLASLRPTLSELLPRQGVPPTYASWEERAEYERWGRRSRLFPDHGEPWWELRPHDELGTIELRVPDAQTTPQDAAGVLAFAAGLVAGWPSGTTPVRRCPCTTARASARTAGARCATASTAACSTSRPASRSPRASACSR